jgi:perosamine synthetase
MNSMRKKKSQRSGPKLAIRGGAPVLEKPLPPFYNVGKREKAAAMRVLDEGLLSDFIGAPGEHFLGGPRVRSLERAVQKKFKVRHAVSFNSGTTALHGAIVALGIGPGDEVILPPYTMSASATAILMNGAVPIFADIDPRTFCLDAQSVRARITKHTKAIMVVNLFGQAADFDALLSVAKEHGLKVIEDNAQAIGATWRGRYTGTIGDVGVFSFNFHKMIQSGEGGVLVTNNDRYALRARLSRNHGENLSGTLPADVGPIFGSNYRMTELTAAIAEVQLSRLPELTRKRMNLVRCLTESLQGIRGLELPYVAPENTHVYFVYPLKVRESELGISRDTLVEAMRAEGFPMSRGYVQPLYLLPLFQQKKAFNNTDFPFKHSQYGGTPDYSKGICPVAERLHEKEFTFTMASQHIYTLNHIRLFVKALKKVLAHREELTQ